MLPAYFTLAALSPSRQHAFRVTLVAHLLLLLGCAWSLTVAGNDSGPAVMAVVLLSAGIAEGGLLVGWRLTQMPKSQALEFLLVSPLRPHWVFLDELAVSVARLGLVTLCGLPVLLLLAELGHIDYLDVLPLLLMPFTWGVMTGVGLIYWAYEPLYWRRWGERLVLALVVLYLAVGVLAGENLRLWLKWLPDDAQRWFLTSFFAFHAYNPFGLLRTWMTTTPGTSWAEMLTVQLATMAVVAALTLRAAYRLQGHFQERHYRPAEDRWRGRRGVIGERPLSWWAVRRVTEYAGRVNLYLAGGFGILYAMYTVAGPQWPAWLGRQVFVIFDGSGGIPVLATGLVLLAAVPAAFQYGLWDSNAQDRCRRLELLLLTGLEGGDYWHAAAAAAWRRGRGYFGVAVLLWASAAWAGQMTALQFVAAVLAGGLLLVLYFSLGFWAFSRGVQANGLGMLLTLGLPLAVFALVRLGLPALGTLLPPGGVYVAGRHGPSLLWLCGPLLTALAALVVARHALAQCDARLRHWYDLHHGCKVLE